MEFVSGHWDPQGKRWIGGAQDNDVQVGPVNGTTRALGVVMGDGTVTAVDAKASPPRLFGCTQNLGNFADDDRPGRRRLDDDESYGFGFYQEGKGLVGIPLLDWFDVVQFPFFSQPYALNSVNGTQILLFADDGARAGSKLQKRGLYVIDVPRDVTKPKQIKTPTLEVSTDGAVYDIVAGGATDGKPDASVIVALNDTHLLVRSKATKGALVARPLPTRFARPVIFDYVEGDDGFEYILGPTSHDKTVSLAVSPASCPRGESIASAAPR